jgi:hypothetical protein
MTSFFQWIGLAIAAGLVRLGVLAFFRGLTAAQYPGASRPWQGRQLAHLIRLAFDIIAECNVTYQIGRTIAGGIGFGVLPLLAGWKFHVAGVSLTRPAAYAAIGVPAALFIRFSIRRGVE